MTRRLLSLAILALALSLAAAPAASASDSATATAAAKKKKKCKRGYQLKSVKVGKGRKARRVRRCVKVRRKAAAKAPASPAPAAPAPAAPAPAAPVSPPSDQSGITKQRDDNVGRQAMQSMGAALKLERAEFGASGRTADYNRMWFFDGGQFQWYTIGWNDVSGESCSTVRRGTWSLKEGGRYSSPQGGGVYVVVSLSFNGGSGDELLVFPDSEQSSVYVSPKAIRFDKNENIADNC